MVSFEVVGVHVVVVGFNQRSAGCAGGFMCPGNMWEEARIV